jgi:hypothetical protein
MMSNAPYTEVLTEVLSLFREYMHIPDSGPFLTVLGSVAAHRLSGPPAWLMLVGPPGSGKSELLYSTLTIPKVHLIGTIAEAALLSGTPKKDIGKGATGGLLRKIGNEGIIVAKDFTTVLSMHRDQRSVVLAALRELHDGRWVRHLGTDGGREIPWQGRLGFIGAVTDVIDSHHAVISTLGDRFLYCRLTAVSGLEVARKVIERTGTPEPARSHLQDAVCSLIECLEQPEANLTVNEKDWLALAANVAALARSGIERDGYRRDITRVLKPESPGRLAEGLSQLFIGLLAIGCSPEETRRLIRKVAIDCIPSDRSRLIRGLAYSSSGSAVENMRNDETVNHPKTAVHRALEEMECLRIVERKKGKGPELWTLTQKFQSDWNRLH